MNDNFRLLVIIINYKTSSLVLDCVDSLQEQLDHSIDHIVVVDNNSGVTEVDALSTTIATKKQNHLVSIISSSENKGFAAGNNIGITAFSAENYLLANADTIFRDGAIDNLLKAAKQHEEAGLISPRLEWKDGTPQKSCFRFHSPPYELICSAGTGLITSLLKRYDVPLEVVDKPSRPDWTSFACVLIRKEVLQLVGSLDEGYFMYYEDMDYCRLAKRSGFEILNYPDSHVVHLRGQSSGIKKLQTEKKRLPNYHYESRARYYTKFYGTIGFLASNICWSFGRTISLAREILFGKERTVPEFQYLDIWKK